MVEALEDAFINKLMAVNLIEKKGEGNLTSKKKVGKVTNCARHFACWLTWVYHVLAPE